MPEWINDNRIYKPVYALFCLITSAVVSVIAGYDYSFLLLNQSEKIYSSYGELLVAIVFAISGVIVLVSRKVHLPMLVCLGLVLIQVMSFFFCKEFETTLRVSGIKWIPLVTAVFTMLLIESKKKDSGSTEIVSLKKLFVIKKVIAVIIGFALIGSGVCALFQSGVLYAYQTFYSNKGNYVALVFSIGLVMFINGLLILFFMTSNIHKAVSVSMIVSLIIAALFLLVRGMGSVQTLTGYMVFYIVIMFLSAVCVLFLHIMRL